MPENPVSPSTVHLIGGGWSAPEVYAPFLEAASERSAVPRIGCVVVDEGDGPGSGEAQVERWASVLRAQSACEPVPVVVPLGGLLDPSALDGLDAVLVCGGLTPAYADALRPAAEALRRLRYCGFSAGAAVAARRAVVGGWRAAGLPVCPEDAAEDLEDVTVVDGLDLVPFTVDVHAAQWGTLGRLVAARPEVGLALDEGCLVVWSAGELHVRGPGAATLVRVDGDDAVVRRLLPGTRVALPSSDRASSARGHDGG